AISFEHAGQRRVAAFITTRQEGSLDDVRGFLRRELPDYMQPAVLVAMDALPLTPMGKLDRARLRVPVMTETEGAATDIEASLRQIWREALGPLAIGRDDNFFD